MKKLVVEGQGKLNIWSEPQLWDFSLAEELLVKLVKCQFWVPPHNSELVLLESPRTSTVNKQPGDSEAEIWFLNTVLEYHIITLLVFCGRKKRGGALWKVTSQGDTIVNS